MVTPINTINSVADINFTQELQQEESDYQVFQSQIDPLISKIFDNAKGKTESLWDAMWGVEDNVTNIANYRLQLSKLEEQLKILSKAVSSQKDDPKKLLQLEQKFVLVRKNINVLKKMIVVQVEQFKLPEPVKYQEMLSRYDQTIKEIERELAIVNKALVNCEHPVQPETEKKEIVFEVEIQKVRGETFLAYSEVKKRIDDIRKRLKETHEMDISETVDKHAEILRESLKKIGKSKNIKEIEKLRLEFYSALQDFEIAISDAIVSKRSDPYIDTKMNAIEQSLKGRYNLIAKLSEAQRANRVPDDESSEFVAGLEEIMFSTDKAEIPYNKEIWQYKLWGGLLIPEGVTESVKNSLGAGFRESVTSLKQKKHQIQQQLAVLPEDDPLRPALEKEEVDIKRALYHTVLTRIIDVIGEKEWQLRQIQKGKLQVDPATKDLLEFDLGILNEKFEKVITKYKNLPKDEFTLMESLTRGLKEQVLNFASLGYYNGKTYTYEEFLAKKHYADMGYSMTHYIQEWLETEKVSRGMDAKDYLKKEVKNFIKWAEKHPNRAATMVSDMALTVTLIAGQDQSFVGQFRTQMEAKAYSMAFMAPFGGPDWEPLETEKELKYRALADLSRYAPVLVGAGRNVINEIFSGNMNLPKMLFEAAKGGVGAALVQKASDLIPHEAAQAAAAVLSVAQGRGFREVMETQRNIELTRLGGLATKAIVNPKGFMKDVGRRMKLWWGTMQRCTGVEKVLRTAVQVVMPVGCVVGAAGLISVVILGGPITWVAALGGAAAFLAFGGGIIWRSNNAFNQLFPKTIAEVRKTQEKVALAEAKKILERNNKNKIKKARDDYIRDLQAARQIPYVRPPENLKLSKEQKKAVDAIIRNISEHYLTQLRKEPRGEEDVVGHLNEHFKIDQVLADASTNIAAHKDLSMRLIDQQNLSGYVAYHVAGKVLNQWLRPEIQKEMVDQAVRKGNSKSEKQLLELKTPENETEYRNWIEGQLEAHIEEEMQEVSDDFEQVDAEQASREFFIIWKNNSGRLVHRDKELSPQSEKEAKNSLNALTNS